MMFASTSSRSSIARASFRRATTTTAKKCVRGQGHGVKTSIGGNRRFASNGRTRRVAVEAGTFFKTKADIEADIEAKAEVEAEPEVKAEVEAEVEAEVVTSEETLEADAAPEEEDVEKDSFGAKKLPCGALLFTFDA